MFNRASLGITALANGTILAVGFVTGMLLARNLEPSARGQVALIVALTGVLTQLSDYSAIQTVSSAIRSGVRPSAAIRRVVAASSPLLAAVCAASVLAGILLGVSDSGLVFMIAAAAAIPSLIGGVFSGALLGMGRLRLWNATRILSPLLWLATLSVLLLINTTTATSVGVGFVLCAIAVMCASAAMAAWAMRHTGHAGSAGEGFARKALPVHLGELGWALIVRQDVLLLGVLSTDASVGIYAVAMSLAAPMWSLLSVFGVLAQPALTGVDAETQQRQIGAAFRTLALAGIPASVGLLLVMPALLPAYAGEEYADAVLPAQVLVVAQIPLAYAYLCIGASRAVAGHWMSASIVAFGVLLNVALIVIFVPDRGALGAALASLIAYLVVGVMAFAFLWWVLRGRARLVRMQPEAGPAS